MTYKLITFVIFPCLIIALLLSGFGITRLELGGPFIAFLKSIELRMQGFTIEIPSIPLIPETSAGFEFFSMFINFINGIITFINFLITAINMVIKVIQFIIMLLVSVTELITGIKSYNDIIGPSMASMV